MQTILAFTALLMSLKLTALEALTTRQIFAFDTTTQSNLNIDDVMKNNVTSKKSLLPTLSPSELLNFHNKVRRGEGASNMIELRWDKNLANHAKKWISNCSFKHARSYVPDFLKQNLHFTTGPFKYKDYINDGIVDWFNEKASFDFETGTCKETCANYMTMVKWDLTLVGCAVTECPYLHTNFDIYSDAAFLSCEYYSPVNDWPAFPYITGEPCTQCPDRYKTCNDKLCSGPDSAYPPWDEKEIFDSLVHKHIDDTSPFQAMKGGFREGLCRYLSCIITIITALLSIIYSM